MGNKLNSKQVKKRKVKNITTYVRMRWNIIKTKNNKHACLKLSENIKIDKILKVGNIAR